MQQVCILLTLNCIALYKEINEDYSTNIPKNDHLTLLIDGTVLSGPEIFILPSYTVYNRMDEPLKISDSTHTFTVPITRLSMSPNFNITNYFDL